MPADLELADQIHKKLAGTRRVLRTVSIRVDDGKVYLCGRVPSYHLRQLAVERTRRVPGVRRVEDQITVQDR